MEELTSCLAVLLQPLDVVKTTQQRLRAQNRCFALSSAAKITWSESGAAGLWRGTLPSVARVFLGVGAYFSLLDVCVNSIRPHEGKNANRAPAVSNLSSGQSFICGATARTIAAGFLSPITLLKTQIEYAAEKHVPVRQLIRHVYDAGGILGFWRGILPTVVRDAPFSGIYYASYVKLQQSLPDLNRHVRTATSAGVAACVATVVTNPADVLKTRAQADPQFAHKPVFEIATTLLRTEGSRSLFIGVATRSLKRMGQLCLVWCMYDIIAAELSVIGNVSRRF